MSTKLTNDRVRDILAGLERRGTKANRDGMARYGIVAPKAFGVSVTDLKTIAKPHRKDHELALALWKSGWYEARMLAGFIDDPAQVTVAQMNTCSKDFDNWAVCDHLCFHLYDRTPHAWGRIKAWSTAKPEFVKRASFALLASVALHDKREADKPFLDALPLIERAAVDERNFVKKAVSWALRGIGSRNAVLNAAALKTARGLAQHEDDTARWIGRDAVKGLTSAATKKRIA